MIEDQQLDGLVTRLEQAVTSNLLSVESGERI